MASSALFTVHQTQQALILQFGNPVRVETEPGLKFKIPFIQNVEYFDKRILDLDPPTQEVLLADQKRINVDAFARYRIVDPLKFKQRAVTLANFRQVFGGLLNSGVRSEVAKVSLAEMLTAKRSEVMDTITNDVKNQAPDFGVEVVDVRIGRTDLPEATSQAVYNRMRSERIAQAAQLRAEGEELKAKIQAEADRARTVIFAEANKTAKTLEGEGDGQRTLILNEAYGQDPSFFDFYRSLEAYERPWRHGHHLGFEPRCRFLQILPGRTGQDAATGALILSSSKLEIEDSRREITHGRPVDRDRFGGRHRRGAVRAFPERDEEDDASGAGPTPEQSADRRSGGGHRRRGHRLVHAAMTGRQKAIQAGRGNGKAAIRHLTASVLKLKPISIRADKSRFAPPFAGPWRSIQ